MKSKHYLFAMALMACSTAANSQSSNWSTNGNTSQGSSNILGQKNFNDIRIITDNKVRMFISGLGKVGIGTTTPKTLLDVHADSTSAAINLSSNDKNVFLNLQKGDINGTAVIAFKKDTVGLWRIGSIGDNNFTFNNLKNGTDAIVIDYKKNFFGINTSSPKAQLDVSGNGQTNLHFYEGDVRIGDDKYRLKMAVDLNGGNAGDAFIASHGGTGTIHLGSANDSAGLYTLNIINGKAHVGVVGDTARFAAIGFTNNSGEPIARFMSKNGARRISISNNSIYADGDSATQDITLRSKGFGNLRFVQGQNERARINDKGDLWIDVLDVNDGKVSGGALRFGATGNVAIASKRTVGDNEQGLDFYTAGVNVPKLSISKNGNVGIGTGNNKPDYKLIVSGFDTTPNNRFAAIKLENTGAGGQSWYISSGSTGNKQGEKSFAIADDSTFRFKIDKKGRVSIGSGVNYVTAYHDLQVGRTTGSDIGIGTTESIQDAGGKWLTVDAKWTPKTDNDKALGDASHRWKRIYSGNGVINTSDMRDKENIQPITYGTDALMKLKPVSYNWKNSDDRNVKLGLIAQDLQTVIPEVVVDKDLEFDEATNTNIEVKNERLGVYYSDLIPVLIKGFQEQNGSVNELKTQNEKLAQENVELKNQMSKVMDRLNTIESALSQCCTNYQPQGENKATGTDTKANGYMMQNQPNPFSEKSVIKFYIPTNYKSAQIKIADLNGTVLKSIEISTSGYSEIIINGNELTQGTYSYSLYINAELTDSKLMILTK